MSLENATYRWKSTVELNGKSYNVSWEPHEIGGMDDYWEYQLEIEGSDQLKMGEDFQIALLASDKRIQEIREEFCITGQNAPDDVIVAIALAAYDGAYMSQASGRDFFFVSDLARILGYKGLVSYLPIVEDLRAKKLLGRDALRLIPYERENAIRRALEERTGHKDINFSDDGSWYCAVCKKSGDPQDPETTPASKVSCVS